MANVVLDFLNERELCLRKAKLETVAVVKFRLNKRGGNSSSSGIVDEKSDTTKFTEVMESRLR